MPMPVDTSDVRHRLPEWKDLVLELAEAAHTDWYASRVAEGKTVEELPILKPWKDLDEKEKASAIGQAEETVLLLEKRLGMPGILDGTVPESAVVDAVAENAHEVWAKQRMDAGWIWGEERDNAAKKHPMLKPYSEIPDSEKEYDRAYGRVAVSVMRSRQALRRCRDDALSTGSTVSREDACRAVSAVRSKLAYEEAAGKRTGRLERLAFQMRNPRPPYPSESSESLIDLLNRILSQVTRQNASPGRSSSIRFVDESHDLYRGFALIEEVKMPNNPFALTDTFGQTNYLVSFRGDGVYCGRFGGGPDVDDVPVESWEARKILDGTCKPGTVGYEFLHGGTPAPSEDQINDMRERVGKARSLGGRISEAAGVGFDAFDAETVKGFVCLWEENERVRRAWEALPEGPEHDTERRFLSERSRMCLEKMFFSSSDVFDEVVSRMDKGFIPEGESVKSAVFDLSMKEYCLDKGIEPGTVDRNALWNDSAFVEKYAGNAYLAGIPVDVAATDVKIMSRGALGNDDLVLWEYRKERASLVKDFGEALKDGNPSAVYSKLSEKNRVANDALENARAAAERLERFSTMGRTVELTVPQSMLYDDMMEGMKVAAERGGLAAFLRDAGISFTTAPGSESVEDTVAKAAKRMYGNGTKAEASLRDRFLARQKSAVDEGRARRRSREFALHGAKENKIPKPKVNQVK